MVNFSDNKRFHDAFYVKEDQFTEPKEYFKKAGSLFIEYLNKNNLTTSKNFLDIGCAAGDFLKYIDNVLDKDLSINYFGSDVMPELLTEAKKRFNKGDFFECDLSINNKSIEEIIGKKFDCISMLGVHTIFDNLNWIDNIVNSLNQGGLAIIYSFFNPYPYDVVMRVKKSKENKYQPGWNVHSKLSVKDKCSSLGVNCKFIDFQPDIDIPRDEKDGLRSWSMNISNVDNQLKIIQNENLENNSKRIFTNGTRIIHDFSFCLISK